MVTSEYTITFTDSISEFEMLLLCKLGDDFSYNEDYTVCTIESLMGEREFIREIADLVDGADVHLSLSHDAGIASAMVIVERN